MTKESFFLIFNAVGVSLVSLGYGFNPAESLPRLYEIELTNNNMANIFRAVMGLYIGFATLWILGAVNKDIQLPALWSLIVFMTGIGLGRALSMILDGMPDFIFVGYMIIEFVFASIGYLLIKGLQKNNQ